MEDVDGITFSWSYSNQSGSEQAGYHIATSEDDGTSWQTLIEETGSQKSALVPHNVTPTGAILWRIQVQNTTGEYGPWSLPVGIIVRAASDTPSVTSIDTKPRPSIMWQSVNQQAYRVVYGELDAPIYDTGMLYGTAKDFRIPFYLDDGEYTIRVQIQNDSGLTSAWAQVQTTVENQPQEEFALNTKSRSDAIMLSWAVLEGAVNYYVERDGVPVSVIAAENDLLFTDYLCRGLHEYRVRAVDADDYYTLSNAAPEKSLPLYGMLVPMDDPANWLLLKWKQGAGDAHEKSGGLAKEYITYQGREKPVVFMAKARTVTVNFSYRFLSRDAVARLEELDGKTVLYKNFRGDYYFGTLDTISSSLGRYSDMGFSIVQTDYSEAVAYL